MAPPNETLASDAVLGRDLSSGDLSTNMFCLSGGKFTVNGVTLFSDVPENVAFRSFSSVCRSTGAPESLFRQVQSSSYKGGFLGFSQQGQPSDRLVNSLGKFTGRDFLSIFRFKTWWSTMWMGRSGSDLQMETQWVLLHVPELDCPYVLLLPLLEGGFRSAIHAGDGDHVMICAEGGSPHVRTCGFEAIAYVHACDNPFTLMTEAYSAARIHLDTFRLIQEKSLPPIVDKFGWCTWDAFYLTVEPLGVWQGVQDFADGGLPARFLIIDDGWQSISNDGENPLEGAKNLVLGGEQMTARLHRLQECDKFMRYEEGAFLAPGAPRFDPEGPKRILGKAIELENAQKAMKKAVQSGATDVSSFKSKIARLRQELDQMLAGGAEKPTCGKLGSTGLRAFINDLKKRFQGLDDVYVWQALCGAWGGVRPGATHLDSKIVSVKLSPGLAGTMDDLAVDKIVEGGIGLVRPDQAADLYDSMHSYLANAGVTGVKVDVIHTLEYVCEEYGGRVELAKAYYNGLSKSLVKNFNGTGIISSMQQCNDFFFLGTWQVPMGRAGDDFWFEDPNGDPMGAFWLQGAHMVNCAFNSLWMGQFILPDWDMFKSDHVCAVFHAASRAICGGPVYVSDSVGSHDFELLRKLVFPDGTIPRCLHYALPTRDCLFRNPLFDQETVLKIWNLNKFGGVIGAFNCQGAGWDPKERRVRGYSHCYKRVSGEVRLADVEWGQRKEEAGDMGEAEEYAVYAHQAEKLELKTPTSDAIRFTLQPSSFELFSFVPVKKLAGVKFAPIGLANMFNSGGTVVDLEHGGGDDGERAAVHVKVKGGGKFLAYSSRKPAASLLEGAEVGVEWTGEGKLTVDLPWNGDHDGVSHLIFAY